MIYITISDNGNGYDLYCRTAEGKTFTVRIGKDGSLLERPDSDGIDETTAYFHVKHMIEAGEPLPEHEVAAWG